MRFDPMRLLIAFLAAGIGGVLLVFFGDEGGHCLLVRLTQ